MRQTYYISINESMDPFIGKFMYQQTSKSLMGTATMTTAYGTVYNDLLVEGANIKVATGSNDLDLLFDGTAKYIDRQSNQIVVELVDNGANFKQPYKGNYKKEELSEVIDAIAATCGFEANFDAVDLYKQKVKITRSPHIEESTLISNPQNAVVGDTESSICGTFTAVCPKCRDKYPNKTYVTSVENRCTKCGKRKTLSFQNNEYFCEACGTHYCGIDGFEKTTIPVHRLSILYGPTPGSNYSSQPEYSATNVTCEDELFRICSAYNLYVYKTPDKQLVVREYAGFPNPDYVIPDTLLEYKTFSTLQNANQKIKGVDIAYDGGSISKDIKHVTDTIGERLTLSRLDLDKTAATNLAKDLLVQQIKDLQSDFEIITPINAKYTPGIWVGVDYFSKEFPFNIMDAYHKIETGKFLTTLKLKLYPEIFESDDIYTDKYTDALTFDLIKATAEGYTFSYSCHTGTCIGHKKTGDTFAMSEWLTTKLRKINVRARILQYSNPILENKESQYVQYYENGAWKDFDYSKFDVGFQPSTIKQDLKVVNSN